MSVPAEPLIQTSGAPASSVHQLVKVQPAAEKVAGPDALTWIMGPGPPSPVIATVLEMPDPPNCSVAKIAVAGPVTWKMISVISTSVSGR